MEREDLKETIRERFSYDPITGVVTSRITRGRQVVGSPVGTVVHGRLRVLFKFHSGNITIALPDIIWVLVHGRFPLRTHDIDHINRDKLDNRLCNLREITLQENRRVNFDEINSKRNYNGISNR